VNAKLFVVCRYCKKIVLIEDVTLRSSGDVQPHYGELYAAGEHPACKKREEEAEEDPRW